MPGPPTTAPALPIELPTAHAPPGAEPGHLGTLAVTARARPLLASGGGPPAPEPAVAGLPPPVELDLDLVPSVASRIRRLSPGALPEKNAVFAREFRGGRSSLGLAAALCYSRPAKMEVEVPDPPRATRGVRVMGVLSTVRRRH